jgi:hypothetical protein
LRNVINAGRDAMDALATQDERRLRHTAKSCGPDLATLDQVGGSNSAATVTRRIRRRGARDKPLKPLRREGRVIPVNL